MATKMISPLMMMIKLQPHNTLHLLYAHRIHNIYNPETSLKSHQWSHLPVSYIATVLPFSEGCIQAVRTIATR